MSDIDIAPAACQHRVSIVPRSPQQQDYLIRVWDECTATDTAPCGCGAAYCGIHARLHAEQCPQGTGVMV